MTLQDKMTELADGFRNKFDVEGLLSLDDMIDLLTKPQYPILVQAGQFGISQDWNGTSLTSYDGALVMSSNCFIGSKFYTSEKSRLDNPSTRPALKLRFHFFLDSRSYGDPVINWGINGLGLTSVWQATSGEEVSEFTLDPGVNVDSNNSLALICRSGFAVLDLSRCFVEITTA